MSEVDHNLLVMEGISKAFPGVQALDDVSLTLKRGEILCLVGENGAGKSTLMKILTGVDQPNAGKIIFDGNEIQAKSPQHAQSLGISTVYQEINLCTNLTVAENILLGREPHKMGRIDWAKTNELASETLQRLLFYRAAMDSNQDATILLEEPEAHLFPHYAKYFSERIARFDENQYFISTHNPFFLNALVEKTPTKELTVFAVGYDKGQTRIVPFETHELPMILDLDADIFFNLEKVLAR
jgi:ABC-type branched-subunit amino acid transport system ATPase component